MTSRLSAHCEYCRWSGPRSLTLITLDNTVPSIHDICPECGGDDITVSDAALVELAAPREWVDYGDGDEEDN